MFYISEVKNTAPAEFKTELQQMVYATLQKIGVPFERVDTDEAISMEDCVLINEKLDMQMVKTLFLCNRQQTDFYVFVTTADKPFRAKELSAALNIPRLSFAPVDLLEKMLGTKVGAATIFSVMLDTSNAVQVLLDKDVVSAEYYGCSDGTTEGYMKIKAEYITNDFLQYAKHKPIVVEV
ncbi:YbaK/EbsC family protein [Pontibacter korlensis]|uniref:Prolyl-tRNA synthetase n=1 Tax=Pontibacter korlensis TaxID=400092 RepID=A0A0E3UY86_9BACT|nr:YbaK/EbsC family protein [Pontibacter korlensis]AKD04922.1 prolyl-tRNA synthetase [Pontibacter korlensis]